MEVTFSAGVTVKKAREFMEENDIYFESLTVIQEVHMLGITPTASHVSLQVKSASIIL